MDFANPLKKGVLEVFCGPVKSGKSRELLTRLDQLSYMNKKAVIFQPDLNTRDAKLISRFLSSHYESVFVNSSNPSEILFKIKNENEIVIIDEVQFFSKSIISVIDKLLLNNLHVIVAGLDLDFRAETFGPMGEILARANIIRKLNGICEYPGCSNLASRTQRLIDGKPADYNSPIISIEGAKAEEKYECRCLMHHFVPNKPSTL